MEDADGKLLGYRGLDQIHRQLEPIRLRRTRKEVLKDLPPRTDQVFYVPLTEKQAEPYWEQNDILGKLMQKWQRQGWLSEIDLRRILCCLQNMRMLCNSTFLFDKRTHHSPKLAEFRGIIRELTLEENRKVVVFSEYERMTFLAGEELRKMGIGFVSLPGGVPSRKRGALIEEFHRQPNCRVFLSTDAGGVGLESRSSAGQQVQGALSTLFSRHPQTNHPILSIPLPESFTAERITQAVARFLSALEVPAK